MPLLKIFSNPSLHLGHKADLYHAAVEKKNYRNSFFVMNIYHKPNTVISKQRTIHKSSNIRTFIPNLDRGIQTKQFRNSPKVKDANLDS